MDTLPSPFTVLSPFVICGILTLRFAWGGKHFRVLYLIALFVPGLWLMAPVLLQNVDLPDSGFSRAIVGWLRFDFALWFWEPLSLWLMTYLILIWRGHKEAFFYNSVIYPRRSIWLVFGVTVFLLTIWFSNSLLDAGRRVTGLRAEYEVLANEIEELQSQAGGLELFVYDEATRPALNFAGVSPKLKTLEMQATLVLSYTRALSQSIGATRTLSETQFTAQESNALRQIDLLVSASLIQVDQIRTLLSDEQTVTVSATSAPTQASTNVKEQLVYLTDKIHDAIDDLIPVTAVIARDRSTTFAILTILFAIFLMNPWVLYFSFIISKRSTIARDNRATLEDLGLLSRFLQASVASRDKRLASVVHISKHLEAALDHRQNDDTARADSVRAACTVLQPDDSDLLCQLPALAQLKARLCTDQIHSNPAFVETLLTSALHEAQEFVIGQRQFFSREYIIPLVILTFLTGVGWYYTLLPGALPGLVKLIQDGPTIQTVTEYLTQGFTPITASFAGAWLFTTLMLTIRWTNDDLYPRSFFYAAMRLVFAFLIGVLFTSWVTRAPDAQGVVVFNHPPYGAGLLMVAFAVGAAPLEFVRAILRSAGQTVSEYLNKGIKLVRLPAFTLPDWDSKQPLTELQDLTIWDDTRFFQEGIQNVHALAHGDLERLVLNTPFAANTLIDWIDQAQLHVHATQLWQRGLAMASIGAATELLERCSPRATENFDSASIAEVVASVNDAQQSGLALDDPRRATRDTGLKLQAAADDLAQSAHKARQTVSHSDSANITQLKEQMGSGDTSVKRTLSTLESQCQAALAQLKKQGGAETHPIAEARLALDNVVNSISTVTSAMKDWEDTQTLAQATAVLDEVDALVTSTNQVATNVLRVALPLQLTAGILRNILVAINADSNVKHLQRFRHSRVDSASDHYLKRVVISANEGVETNHSDSQNGSRKDSLANGQRSRHAGSQSPTPRGSHSPDHGSA